MYSLTMAGYGIKCHKCGVVYQKGEVHVCSYCLSENDRKNK